MPRPRKIITSVVMVGIVGTLGAQFVSSGTAAAKVNVVDRSKQQDLAIPAWAASVKPWRDLVNQVSHSPKVVVTRNQRQTNILSESVMTVTNTNKVAMRRYTPGQERLLLLLVLLGSDGKVTQANGLCPLNPTQTHKVLARINATAGSPVGSTVTGKDGAENSLTVCGYLINDLADQLINAPGADKRYVGSVPTAFAYDLGYNWVRGTAAARNSYASNFAKLYADWSKPTSPTYTKLREE